GAIAPLSTARRSGEAQHAVEVGVAEAAVGVEAAADGGEVVPAGVAGSEGGGRLVVHLPPVGAAAEGVHDRLDAPEVLLERRAPVHVHGEIGPLLAERGRQGYVVGGDEADLDGKADHHAAAV